MKRYQLYLNPHSVSVLDSAQLNIGLSRSALIRMAIDGLADNLAKLMAKKETQSMDYPYLDKLVGKINVKGKNKINFSQRQDYSYYQD
ncbi:ribbon-helix-helix domain-containing protein [Patescibacteria group bacterium]|nr:ribbon-helix-helix domain-containing protein [Patescibacteria group bacterium]